MKKLNQKIIYFGHQSVGANILEGFKEILKKYPGDGLEVIKVENPVAFNKPAVFHSRIGKNMYPFSKIDGFLSLMDKGAGKKCDIAFFKFCYVDIKADTNINNLFHRYASIMTELEKRYPKLKLVHFTVPLRTVQKGWKVPIKKLIGRHIGGYLDNIKRYKFNELMREKYGGKAALFDLANIESIRPDGKQCTFSQHNNRYEALVPQYTDDGGHLNKAGRMWVAEQFLLYLASL